MSDVEEQTARTGMDVGTGGAGCKHIIWLILILAAAGGGRMLRTTITTARRCDGCEAEVM